MLRGPLLSSAIVAAVAVGVLSGARPELPAAAACAAAALAALLARPAISRPGLVVALLCAGVARGALAGERALAPAITAWFEARAGSDDRLIDDELVTIDGRLLTDAALTEGGVQTLVSVVRVRDAAGWHRAPGRVQLRITGALALEQLGEWRAGRPIQTPVSLRRPRVLFNYGGASPRLQAMRRPFDLAGTAKSAALLEVQRGAPWDEAAAAVRAHVRRSLARFVAPDGADGRGARAAAVATAILIGDRAGLSDDVERRLQEAGTYHVIAISGGNIALIAAMAFGVAWTLTRSARARSIITLLVVASYGWVVGPDPSVTRAVVAAGVYLAVGLAGLVPRPIHVLTGVAAGISVVDPLSTVDVGAWLSFGATLGILLVTGSVVSWAMGGHRVRRALRPSARSGRPEPVEGRVVKGLEWSLRLIRPVAMLVAASLAAELVLLPIAAAVFGRLSLAGLVLNVVAIPAMAMLQVSSVVVSAAAGWWPGVAALAATVVRLSADALVESARLVDVFPWIAWRVPPAWLGWTPVYYVMVALALTPAVGRWRRPAAALAAGCALIIASAPGLDAAKPRAGWVRLTVLDVGQGDALLAQFPSGHDLLVDAGGGPGSFDVGGRVVTPAVWALGSRRVDWLAITHGDLDHVGGAGTILADLQPREVWEGIPVPRDPVRQRLQAAARARGISWRALRLGDVLEAGGVSIEVCHPPTPEWERQRVRNDDSVVLRVRYGEVEMLLTGDAGPEFERAWTAVPPGPDDAAIRILKAAHHGSRTSSSAAFVEAYRPHIVLVSAGRGNAFGHPAPAVLGRFRDVDAEVFRTDADGALTVETDGVQARVRTALGRSQSIGVLRRPP